MEPENYYYILEGKTPKAVNDILVWAQFFEEGDRTVAKTTLEDDVKVSTVFLGTAHGLGSKPLLFETMIFGGEHDDYCERYTTWEEAEEGHKRAVELASASKSHP